jgi:hypothetical protein
MSNTTDNILKPTLAEFAKELAANGFKVYLFKSDIKRVANGGLAQAATSLGFSRVVDGRECFASVSLTYFDAAQFSFPIKPSTQHGSSMWIGGAAELRNHEVYGSASAEVLNLHNAYLYAAPLASNPLVGRHENYPGTYWGEHGIYEEVPV